MTIGRRPPPAPGAASVDAVAPVGSERPASAAPEPTSMDLRDIWFMALPFRGPADGRRLANPGATCAKSAEICGERWMSLNGTAPLVRPPRPVRARRPGRPRTVTDPRAAQQARRRG